MSEKLKPCPFCGSPALLSAYPHDRPEMFYVACYSPDCYCTMGEFYDRDAMPDHPFREKDAAIAAWNRRAASEEAGRREEA